MTAVLARGDDSLKPLRTTRPSKPKLAVWKLASCDGCQLTLLDCEDELLALAGAVEIAHFTEASSAEIDGPYDVSLVEGSVTTERDARRIVEIRAASRVLVYRADRKPQIASHSVCYDCKLRGTSCVMVGRGIPCLGPVTQAGCGAICPAFGRGCYGCFGPTAAPNLAALTAQLRRLGMTEAEVDRVFTTFNVASPVLTGAV